MAAVKSNDTTMLFCPDCANLLLIKESTTASDVHYHCITCDYVYAPAFTLKSVMQFEGKKVDDVLGGDSAWKYAPMINLACIACGHKGVANWEMQTRSADEPMTQFYRCPKCSKSWKQ